MATPVEVVEALAAVREGSTVDRARSAATAFRAFASLTATEKRDLAVLVAERVAPHLVPRIEAETGLDLTREQIQAVLDMAGRLEADDITELQRTVADVVEELDEQPPPAEHEPDTLPSDEFTPTTPEVELDPEPAPTVAVAPAPEPKPFVSIFDTLPDTPAWDPPAGAAVAATATLAPVRTVPSPLVTDEATARVRAARQPLVERLRAATSNAARLRVLHRDLDALVTMDRAGRLAVVDAVPDGWARRRAIEAMLAAGVLPAAEVPALLRRISSRVARAWVCASAIEADMLRVAEVDGLVDGRAADRLARRYG